MQPRDPKQSFSAPVARRLEQELVSMSPIGRHFIKVAGDLALGFTDRRHSEKGNQDRLLVAWNACAAVKKDRWFFAGICDGVGGESDGDIAASIALAEAVAALCVRGTASDPVQGIKLAALAAHKAVLRRLQGRSATTFAGFFVNAEGKAAFGWVGDSRIYQLRQDAAHQLSYDDTLEEMLKRKSLLTSESSFDPAWAELQPRWKESLGQAIGSDLPIEPHAELWPNKDLSDGCILCTDGVWKPLEGVFDKVISSGIKQQDVARRLLSTSDNLGGIDNATAIILPSVSNICEWLNTPPYSNTDLVEIVFPDKTLIAPAALFVGSARPELKSRTAEKEIPNKVEAEKPNQQRKKKKKLPAKPSEPSHSGVQFSIVESSEDDTTKSVSQIPTDK